MPKKKYKCDNCEAQWSEHGLVLAVSTGTIKLFPDIPKLSERLEPGGIVPAFECPDCGALAYPVTVEEVDPYVANAGTRCPFCDSDQVEGDTITMGAGSANQEMGCLDCDKAWQAQYKLTGYVERT